MATQTIKKRETEESHDHLHSKSTLHFKEISLVVSDTKMEIYTSIYHIRLVWYKAKSVNIR